MQLSIKEAGNKGSALAHIDEQKAGEMTYSITGADMIIIDHTAVEEAARGMGVGEALLEHIVAMAREKNIKILPLCPFASAVFDKRPELRDVLR